ncbi:putative two-component sensor kinase [Halomonas sp. A3H3]|nr:putative two-component sensor kinase [Halomonas sp. A3H3]
MDMDTIITSWMVIATSSKKDYKKSQNGRRRVLGEKGIGRFATARIADELELFTRTSSQSFNESYAVFDWTQFDDDEKFLSDILFLAEEQVATVVTHDWCLSKFLEESCDASPHGTYLKMNGLKHTWERHDIETLQRGLSRLLSPFFAKQDFNIFLELPEAYSDFNSKIAPPEIIKYPHYILKGWVNDNGEYYFSVSIEAEGNTHEYSGFFYNVLTAGEWELHTSKETPVKSEFTEYERLVDSGPFEFELRIWDRDELENLVQKLGGGIRSVRKDLDAIAGVNIYRDGFRVLPYGEPNNDWLRLDIRRVQAPTKRLSNNQITGYITITADKNPNLHDRSNREGLDNNSAYFDLQNIMRFLLNETENLRYVSKRETLKKSDDDDQNKNGLFQSPDFEKISASLKDDKSNKEETLQLISKAEDDWKKQIKKLQSVLSQYHALATLGGIVDKILHDGRQPLAKIQTEAGLGLEASEDFIKNNPDDAQFKIFEKSFGKIVSHSTILRDVFQRAEPFGGRKRGRPKKYYIESLIQENFSNYEQELKEANVSIHLPETSTLVSVDTTELSEIFINLITNSLYWLKSVPKDRRSIHVLVERKKTGALEIIFSDTGPGIDVKYKDRVFEPYFSKKPNGDGLGLSLVGEIIHGYYNGSVELLDTGVSGGATFRILLNKRV